MALEPALANLQAEAKCQICLSDMTDPVTLNCGHNFCSFCITQSWACQGGESPCAVCRHSCEKRMHRINHQLKRMFTIHKQLYSQLSKAREEKARCERHNQILTLFCEEDLELLCPLCAWPPLHPTHQVWPIEEAASFHRERFHGYIKSLNREVAGFQNLHISQGRQQSQLKRTMEDTRRKLYLESGYLKQLVDQEQQAVMSRLRREEWEIALKFNENNRAFVKHISAMSGLQSEMLEKSLMPAVELLMDLKSIFHRCESLKPPAFYSLEFRKEGYSLPPQFSTLQTIRWKFKEEITLDPETAPPHLRVSEDKKSVRCMQREQSVHLNPGRCVDYPALLGSQRFSSGRHYWEVRVDGKPEWAVGVCRDTLLGTSKWLLPGWDSCWMVQLQDGGYVAPVTLQLTEKPSGIGIYLDYELGEVSFYNLSDNTHIYSFRDTFSGALRPYFYVGYDSKPLFVQ